MNKKFKSKSPKQLMLFWLFLFGKASLTEARFNWRYDKSVAK
ncbi:hypothetical protein HMPREF0519_2587 [Lentilactobacillus hilgardii DSM 20176 = ATCC 8290]|uniref:Uncharacterized protein n=1 Tax=Lentilactobacillus hilgardii (strain ATCC 8290 / DSM 20176 / CCUG 30140 / JCM 1155 / KCTC 3500 / NBRC 15886 / NCIMB 8040 / NRRL B-1843 / 9) TaxID=1423757 RepID=C0XMX6_LENH9|nr:hypothetical protein HMPREF0519_2587 [Lentilactobacillus hilgardii DSM 20176 = ATCC 8290]